MTALRFKEVHLKGGAAERGYQQGKALKSEIAQALAYYKALFNLPDSVLQAQLGPFRQVIEQFKPAYMEEMAAIAQGAGLSADDILLLNARSELLNNLSVSECTTVYNQPTGLLAQNWDWSKALEPLISVLHIEQAQGPRITTLTEPGMLAKVGMNSAGLAVSLNILKSATRLQGLPVHLFLRAVLECESLAQVKALLKTVAVGKASHVLVADAQGEFLSIEFAADKHYLLASDHHGIVIHSNHYLADTQLNTQEAFPSTYERYRRAAEILSYDRSDRGVQSVLLDQSEGLASICRPYSPSALANFGEVGTVFSVLMKPAKKTISIRPGCKADTPFYQLQL
ncbi:C45 family peptidase [Dasania sp. GY-MA-18]|uniref:C45 family peptidase n=1 Tax=Dasania phycosphaerae TaxID=2950436 RepID=A0A9J6RJU4_9GAMM|nr:MULTISPECIES: C45 family peptidase [Dasania]MCR8922246.1 C45 family peptidase [Dasania sp. GY-MA-18]MCZ0864674.1 C45 family peptidase [Dasania phycosphaerae]MCZ0868402.1 C45 family peptidase [Dasania phycosphaerae]